MKLSFQHIIFCLLAIIGFAACSDDHDPIVSEERQQSKMVFHLSCEADADADTRLVGDPGVAEEFVAPQYVYAIVAMDVKNTSNADESKIYVLQNSESKWRRNGRYFDGDVIFDKTNIYYDGMTSVKSARAYLIVAPVALSFTNLSDCGFTQFSTDGQREDNATEEKIKNLIVAAHNDGVDLSGNTLNLRDLYSTPFNLADDGSEITVESDFKTKYYAKATKIEQDFSDPNNRKISIEFGSIEEPIILYHTAAKVDFMWEAENPTQDNVMKSITVNNSPNSGYAFKPVANVNGTSYTDTYSTQVVVGSTSSATPIQVTWPTEAVDATGADPIEINGFYFVGNNSKVTLTKSGFYTGGNSEVTARHIYFTPTYDGVLMVEGSASGDNTDRYIFVATAPGDDHTDRSVVASVAIPEKGVRHKVYAVLRPDITYYVCLQGNGTITDLKFRSTNPLAPEQKWNGRAYSYVLQPDNYTLNYTITTTGKADEGDRVKTADTNQQDMVLNPIFASWYLLRYKLKTSN